MSLWSFPFSLSDHFVSCDNVYEFATTTPMLHKILILTNMRDMAS